jgi:hypothetical protein
MPNKKKKKQSSTPPAIVDGVRAKAKGQKEDTRKRNLLPSPLHILWPP